MSIETGVAVMFFSMFQVEQSELVRRVVSGYADLAEVDNLPFWVVYVTQEGLTEGGPTDQGVVYLFPRQDNTLCSVRGAFLTLHHLVPELTTSSALRYALRILLISPYRLWNNINCWLSNKICLTNVI